MRETKIRNWMLRAAVTARHPELLRSTRGLSMLEYALMALVVLVVFGALLTFFPNFFSTITDRISNLFGGRAPTSI